ncbi:sensor histidine kinase [Nesterenkonia sandarakina]|uniref:histidine kinase n=1 Tax=Nesterenkonia sandarakina TaxID=272918 RepID=A0A7Z0J3A2_9MICC|nr:HAMP domain-containing sensor histidine kinase [Nesterenkonia sandarakina]NYJ16791.1 signal transduction histidine kinase [Nesterenkonia sandarakina]
MTRFRTFVGALLYHSSGKTFALIQQLTFVAVLATPVLMLLIFEPETSSVLGAALGLGVLFAATLAVVLAPRSGVPRVLEWLVPVAGIVACGICRYATYPEGAVISTLSLVPSLWLVVGFRQRGAAVAVLMVVLSISIPSFFVIEETMNFSTVSRFLVFPVALALMSFAVIGILQTLEAKTIHARQSLLSERRSLAQFERTDRLLRGVLENLNVGVLVMDADGNDVMTNRAQREIHSLASPETNPDRTEAGHLVFYTDGSSIPAASRPAARANRGEEFDNLEFLVGAPGPTQRVISVTARAVWAEQGDRDASFLIFRDVTEQHNLLRAQQEVIAAVSHEMRTPLTSIVGFTDFTEDAMLDLEDSPARVAALDQLSVIRRNAEKLSKLVEDLLLEQQAAVGRLTLDLEPVSVTRLVTDCVEGLQPLAAQREISLSLSIDHCAEVVADSLRVSQVLDNLVGNALKYTHTGGRVTVSVGPAGDGGDGVVVQVADDGPGMTQKEASQVFTPFYRARSARQSATAGAGLGLALSQSIVEAHGGTISVRASPGEGARFSFTLSNHITDRPQRTRA